MSTEWEVGVKKIQNFVYVECKRPLNAFCFPWLQNRNCSNVCPGLDFFLLFLILYYTYFGKPISESPFMCNLNAFCFQWLQNRNCSNVCQTLKFFFIKTKWSFYPWCNWSNSSSLTLQKCSLFHDGIQGDT